MRYNDAHGITPTSVKKAIHEILSTVYESDYVIVDPAADVEKDETYLSPPEIRKRIEKLKKEMRAAAMELEFERAVQFRDKMFDLERRLTENPLG